MPTLIEEIARLRAVTDQDLIDNPYRVHHCGMAVIEQQARMIAAAREAPEYIRHRDSRWHDDDVATPAIAFLAPDQELDPGPVETVVRLDSETEVAV